MVGAIRGLTITGAIVAALLSPSRSDAGTVVIDFESNPELWDTWVADNLTLNGIRFSPVNHIDIVDAIHWSDRTNPAPPNYAMGWDSPEIVQPNYLGPTTCAVLESCAPLYIDAFGARFTLESFRMKGAGLGVRSSKGGVLLIDFGESYGAEYMTYLFNGPEWQDLDWIVMEATDCGAPCTQVDDLIFSVVPIPAAAWLFGSGLASLGWLKRRAQT
jgi:hypothetical protein